MNNKTKITHQINLPCRLIFLPVKELFLITIVIGWLGHGKIKTTASNGFGEILMVSYGFVDLLENTTAC